MKKLFLIFIVLLFFISPVFAGYTDLCQLITHKSFKANFIPDTSKIEKSLSLSAGTLNQKGLANLSTIPGLLKVYVPAGTVYGYLNLYLPINNKTGYVVRYNHAPECKHYYSRYEDIPWDVPNRIHLSDMEQRDVYLRNWGGITAVISPFSLSKPLSKGGWLYIRRLSLLGGSTVHKITASFRVNVQAYKEWYDNETIPSGDVSVITPSKPTGYIAPPQINNDVQPTLTDNSGAIDAIFSSNLPEPDIIPSVEVYAININGEVIRLELGEHATVLNGNTQFTLNYKRFGNRIEIYDDDDDLILELIEYKEGLLVIPVKKLVLVKE